MVLSHFAKQICRSGGRGDHNNERGDDAVAGDGGQQAVQEPQLHVDPGDPSGPQSSREAV